MKIAFFKNYLLPCAIVIIIDQVIKLLIIQKLPAFVIYNTEGSWGILPVWMTIGSLISLLILIILLHLQNPVLVAIMAAGVSNLLDRVFHEGVVDYIHLGSFPVFNFADMVITGSVMWFMINELRNIRSQKK